MYDLTNSSVNKGLAVPTPPNGRAKETMLYEIECILLSVRKAKIDMAQKITPLPVDYDESELYKLAVDQHVARIQKLKQVEDELAVLLSSISENK